VTVRTAEEASARTTIDRCEERASSGTQRRVGERQPGRS
jgi:hypothetical protein